MNIAQIGIHSRPLPEALAREYSDAGLVFELRPLPKPGAVRPIRRAQPKVGRNEPCPCGSGRKHKHCCLQTEVC